MEEGEEGVWPAQKHVGVWLFQAIRYHSILVFGGGLSTAYFLEGWNLRLLSHTGTYMHYSRVRCWHSSFFFFFFFPFLGVNSNQVYTEHFSVLAGFYLPLL